ncbi:MAG: hypothetical protein AABW56_00015 [Nanoarchaeota archaeon]|mgnify:CR=1 FL=1
MKRPNEISTIKEFLEKHLLNLVALSVFLLVTFTLAFNQSILNKSLGVLSAGISYILVIDIISKNSNKENITLGIMNSFIILFATLFCVWVILNLVLPIKIWTDILMLILWLIFILGVPVKIYLNSSVSLKKQK